MLYVQFSNTHSEAEVTPTAEMYKMCIPAVSFELFCINNVTWMDQ